MPVLTWELWLARQVVVETVAVAKGASAIDAGRVRQSFGGIIAQIGTPTRARNPEEIYRLAKGKMRQHATRYPIVKKSKNSCG